MATTEVLPKPVGRLQEGGMLSDRSETNWWYKAHCHGKGLWPVNVANVASNSGLFMRVLTISHHVHSRPASSRGRHRLATDRQTCTLKKVSVIGVVSIAFAS